MAGPGSANGYGSYAAALYFVFESIVKTSHYLMDFYIFLLIKLQKRFKKGTVSRIFSGWKPL